MKDTYLLQREDVLVDVILQRLVGVVDAELLEAVCPQVLKSEHIQDTDGQTLKTKQQTGQFINKHTYKKTR